MYKHILILVALSCLMVAIQAIPFVFPSIKIWGKVSEPSLFGRSKRVGYNPDQTTLKILGNEFCNAIGAPHKSIQIKSGDLVYGDYYDNLNQTLAEAGVKNRFFLVVKCQE